MGMYDELICNAKLPGDVPAFIKPGHIFQTKELAQNNNVYVITDQGALVLCKDRSGRCAQDSHVHYCGSLEFYTYHSHSTANNDYEFVEYLAFFEDDKLTNIIETGRFKRGHTGIGLDI